MGILPTKIEVWVKSKPLLLFFKNSFPIEIDFCSIVEGRNAPCNAILVYSMHNEGFAVSAYLIMN